MAPPTAEEPTLGEMWRLMQRIEEAQKDTNKKIDSLAFVSRDVYESDKRGIDAKISGLGQRLDASIKTVSDDLAKTQAALRWLAYTVAGTIISLGLGAAFAAATR